MTGPAAAMTTGAGRAASRPATRRARSGPRRERRMIAGARLLVLVALLGGWEFAAGRFVDDFFISRPSEIGREWWAWLVDGTLWMNAATTFTSFAIGFCVGSLAALVLGYVLGGAPRLAAVFEPFVTGVYSIPKLALIPLFVMWYGVGRELQVAICALVVFFLMFYSTFYGIRDVDRKLIDSMRILGAGRWDIARFVRIPAALTWMVAGLKIAIPQGLIAVVVAEILASNIGLGHLVAQNAGQFNSAGTFAAILTLLIIGLAVDRLAGYLTRKGLRWKQQG